MCTSNQNNRSMTKHTRTQRKWRDGPKNVLMQCCHACEQKAAYLCIFMCCFFSTLLSDTLKNQVSVLLNRCKDFKWQLHRQIDHMMENNYLSTIL